MCVQPSLVFPLQAWLLALVAATRSLFSNSSFALPSLGTQMMDGVKGKTPLYTTEGAGAALSWWSLVLLYISREDPMSGRYPYAVCSRMQDTCKIWSWFKLWEILLLPTGADSISSCCWGEHLQGTQAWMLYTTSLTSKKRTSFATPNWRV